MAIPIFTQLVVGIYLKLHIHEKTIRPYFVVVHGLLGKSYPILGWTQMLFGAIVFTGYCRGDHLGGCATSCYSNTVHFVSRSMSCSLYYGKRIHCLCRPDNDHYACRWTLDAEERTKPGFLWFVCHYVMGMFAFLTLQSFLSRIPCRVSVSFRWIYHVKLPISFQSTHLRNIVEVTGQWKTCNTRTLHPLIEKLFLIWIF